MRYTQVLTRKMIPEWIKLYLNFKLLSSYLVVTKKVKELLLYSKKIQTREQYTLIKKSVTDNSPLMDKLRKDNSRFIQTVQEELDKTNNFTAWKYNDLKQKMKKLQEQIKFMQLNKEDLDTRSVALTRQWNLLMVHDDQDPDNPKSLKKDHKKFKEDQNDLMETFYRFYQEAVYFQSYVLVNNESTIKIIKKYRKHTLKPFQSEYQEVNDTNLKRFVGKIRQLIEKIQKVIVTNYYPHNPKIGRLNLKKYSEVEQQVKKQNVFVFGFFIGYILCFTLIIIFMKQQGFIDPQGQTVYNKVFPCFRGMALLLTYYWVLVIDVVAYQYFKLNYKIFFAFNHHFSTTSEIIKRVSILSTIYLLVFVVYLMQMDHVSTITDNIKLFDPRYLPLISWVILAIYVLIPTRRYLNGQGRMWMYGMAWGSLFGHYGRSEARYIFFTDQFVSLVTPFKDLDYTVCYYYNYLLYDQEPGLECNNQYRVSSLLPYMIPQFMKLCLFVTRGRATGKFWGTDHMWNFFKILLAIQVGWLAFLSKQHESARIIWIPVAICSSLWMYYWDITKEWMFFQPNARHKFLRDDLGYNNPAIYYFLAVMNLFLRATWALSISPNMYKYLGIKNTELFGLMVGFLELTRRLISNFMRIEKEHIVNQNALRTVVDYKYPFKTMDVSRIVLLEEYNSINIQSQKDDESRMTISTIERNFSENDEDYEINMIGETLNKPSSQRQGRQQNVLYRASLNEAKLQQRLSLQANYFLEKSMALEKFQEKNNLEISTFEKSMAFRLTENLSSNFEDQGSSQYSGREISDRATTINMEIINQAKKQEKLQQTIIKQVEDENLEFDNVIIVYTLDNKQNVLITQDYKRVTNNIQNYRVYSSKINQFFIKHTNPVGIECKGNHFIFDDLNPCIFGLNGEKNI